MSDDKVFLYENPTDSENQIAVRLVDDDDYWFGDKPAPGSIRIAVAEEKAVDSYNSTFECGIVLPRPVAVALLLYLQKLLK